jgi:hypothetical protein
MLINNLLKDLIKIINIFFNKIYKKQLEYFLKNINILFFAYFLTNNYFCLKIKKQL